MVTPNLSTHPKPRDERLNLASWLLLMFCDDINVFASSAEQLEQPKDNLFVKIIAEGKPGVLARVQQRNTRTCSSPPKMLTETEPPTKNETAHHETANLETGQLKNNPTKNPFKTLYPTAWQWQVRHEESPREPRL